MTQHMIKVSDMNHEIRFHHIEKPNKNVHLVSITIKTVCPKIEKALKI